MSEVLCLIPGLIDVPLEDLGGLTPMQKAPTPTLDSLPLEEVISETPGGFESAFLKLLGVGNLEEGARGPLEAASLGFSLAPHQRAFSARLLSSGEGVIVDVSDQLLSDEEGRAFFKALPGLFLPLGGPRAVYITSNKEIEEQRECNPIALQGSPWKSRLPESLAHSFEEALVAHEINELRFDLEERPVNGVLLSEGGAAPAWSVQPEYADTLLCTSSAVMHGAARSVGMQIWRLPLEERRFDNIALLLKELPERLKRHSTVILDLPYLWQSTYEGNLREKVKSIEWLDRHFLAPLSERWSVRVHPLCATDIRIGSCGVATCRASG